MMVCRSSERLCRSWTSLPLRCRSGPRPIPQGELARLAPCLRALLFGCDDEVSHILGSCKQPRCRTGGLRDAARPTTRFSDVGVAGDQHGRPFHAPAAERLRELPLSPPPPPQFTPSPRPYHPTTLIGLL